ncbi:unnamed protein product [Urochloa humidicola]
MRGGGGKRHRRRCGDFPGDSREAAALFLFSDADRAGGGMRHLSYDPAAVPRGGRASGGRPSTRRCRRRSVLARIGGGSSPSQRRRVLARPERAAFSSPWIDVAEEEVAVDYSGRRRGGRRQACGLL